MLQHFDADTGELGLALRSHTRFKCAAYSPNGLQIATVSLKDEVELWNTQSCAVEHVIQTQEAVSIVAYSPCGRWIALLMETGGVDVWDARSESSRHQCPGSHAAISLTFSPNGLEFAVGYRGGDIRVWETSTWCRKRIIKGGGRWMAYVVYPPESSRLTCHFESGAKGIRLFDDNGKTLRHILEHDKLKFEQFAYSSCGQWIAAAYGPMVHLWTSTSDGEESNWVHATTVEGFFGRVRNVVWRPNTTEFATASEDGSIRTWKVQEESGHVSAQLLWGHGGTAFTAPGAVLVGSVGLSTVGRKLLEQRGAIFEYPSSANDGA
ncbi:MAG: WD40-repeat-containing domain protein [Linnemannia gamsii]|nr:MAG: WD40-repeat-containing domain protein [Linnemannia gamsii]